MNLGRIPVAVAAAGLLAIAGCTGDPEPEVPTAGGENTSPTTGDTAAQLVEYDDCMREHGVEMPTDGDPAGLEGIDVDEETLKTAMSACEDLMPGGELDLDEETVEELRAWTECMRENGVDIADPGPDGALDLEGVDVGSDTYKAADAAC
ncbi:hypothetical protein HNR23_004789 [Nocardiopsis mwathae]|uniref:Uncharacterized protein n=1 Tax=Nocardiopsis mwathae TaxID=1472723 RepID=A0A7W9YM84_9ACTN|nr:hypothetical protein [Nocardiopsis mwathae]MBB6174729.1 hypothetical protein [Nocardiopsis mwathae]